MTQKYINQYHSEEYSEKKKFASKRLSKLRKRISTFSLRDSGVELSDTKNVLFTKNEEKITYIEETIYSSKFIEIKLSIKRFFGIGKERRRNSEAYHQDGKTNPFE